MRHSKERWNLINDPTHSAVSWIFIEILSFKVWAQIFFDQRDPSTTPKKFCDSCLIFSNLMSSNRDECRMNLIRLLLVLEILEILSRPSFTSWTCWDLLSDKKFHLSIQNFKRLSKIDEMRNQDSGDFNRNAELLSINLLSRPHNIRSPRKMVGSLVQRGWKFFWSFASSEKTFFFPIGRNLQKSDHAPKF